MIQTAISVRTNLIPVKFLFKFDVKGWLPTLFSANAQIGCGSGQTWPHERRTEASVCCGVLRLCTSDGALWRAADFAPWRFLPWTVKTEQNVGSCSRWGNSVQFWLWNYLPECRINSPVKILNHEVCDSFDHLGTVRFQSEWAKIRILAGSLNKAEASIFSTAWQWRCTLTKPLLRGWFGNHYVRSYLVFTKWSKLDRN